MTRLEGTVGGLKNGRQGLAEILGGGLPECSFDLITGSPGCGKEKRGIDVLSGFELALAPTFRDDFRESMAPMVTALTSTGAALPMTSALQDRHTALRFSPCSTACPIDAIVAQRGIQIDGIAAAREGLLGASPARRPARDARPDGALRG